MLMVHEFSAMTASRTSQMSPVHRYVAAFLLLGRGVSHVFSADVVGWFTRGFSLHVRTYTLGRIITQQGKEHEDGAEKNRRPIRGVPSSPVRGVKVLEICYVQTGLAGSM